MLQKPEQWAKEKDFTILDPDGWRKNSLLGQKDFEEEISEEEFDQRLLESTVQFKVYI